MGDRHGEPDEETVVDETVAVVTVTVRLVVRQNRCCL